MQDQRALSDQVQTLIALANKEGLYDAADWAKSHLEGTTSGRITLKVKKAIILIGLGTDRISLTLDLPSTFPAMGYEADAVIETQGGVGIEWCRANLGIEPEVIDARPERVPFSQG